MQVEGASGKIQMASTSAETGSTSAVPTADVEPRQIIACRKSESFLTIATRVAIRWTLHALQILLILLAEHKHVALTDNYPSLIDLANEIMIERSLHFC